MKALKNLSIEEMARLADEYRETGKVPFKGGDIKNIGGIDVEFIGEDVLNKELAFRFAYALDEDYPMNKEWTNKGGWGESWLRKELNSKIYGSLPDELKRLIKDRRSVYIDSDGKSHDVVDKLWILSESELCGVNAELSEGPQFALFTDWKRRIVGKAGNEYGSWQWSRSIYSGGSSYFVCVYSSGSFSINYANFTYGVAPCFAI